MIRGALGPVGARDFVWPWPYKLAAANLFQIASTRTTSPAPDLEDAPVSGDERDVDRKAHEEGVDRVGRRDDERERRT